MTKCISYPRKAVCSEVHGLLYYYKCFFVEEHEVQPTRCLCNIKTNFLDVDGALENWNNAILTHRRVLHLPMSIYFALSLQLFCNRYNKLVSEQFFMWQVTLCVHCLRARNVQWCIVKHSGIICTLYHYLSSFCFQYMGQRTRIALVAMYK